MHRFFVNIKLEKGKRLESSKDMARQLSSVLRMGKGDEIILFDGSEYDFVGVIEEISPRSAEVFIKEARVSNREPKRKLVLFQSLIKKDKFEWVLEKGVEVGVSEFVPILTSRSIKKNFNRTRCESIIQEAAEQSGRTLIPKLRPLMVFHEAVHYAQKRNLQVFFPSLESESADRMVSYPSKAHVALFVGPEGGWNEEERQQARKAGFLIISLGKLTLKSETAAIVTSYQLLH
ncbi:MAG: 16S rRNA (uracil(1498)-N(3))-methyltransferase [Candidatus Niyogibacteria bacterium]|nr:16S rRNA (uracil(1498)-N(3))-methyltransferase [Candidatus Niyogibacteria bacterium]